MHIILALYLTVALICVLCLYVWGGALDQGRLAERHSRCVGLLLLVTVVTTQVAMATIYGYTATCSNIDCGHNGRCYQAYDSGSDAGPQCVCSDSYIRALTSNYSLGLFEVSLLKEDDFLIDQQRCGKPVPQPHRFGWLGVLAAVCLAGNYVGVSGLFCGACGAACDGVGDDSVDTECYDAWSAGCLLLLAGSTVGSMSGSLLVLLLW